MKVNFPFLLGLLVHYCNSNFISVFSTNSHIVVYYLTGAKPTKKEKTFISSRKKQLFIRLFLCCSFVHTNVDNEKNTIQRDLSKYKGYNICTLGLY